mmetsp:Transcript_48428/g.97767  ORF Transcript_48428/g.97767 Transcript_48428/m.97767 type:complete len:194 (+) Transcript_48428:205-786(+)
MLMDLPPKDSPTQQMSKSDGWSVASASSRMRTTGSLRPPSSMSKSQAVASFRAVQAELREEQGRHEKLERRLRKDRERMEGLAAIAERQRGEIGLLRRRGDLFEAYAGECEKKLRQSLAQMEGAGPNAANMPGAADAGAAGAWGPEAAQSLSPVGGFGGAGVAGSRMAASGPLSLARQKSAPTRLPNVLRSRA